MSASKNVMPSDGGVRYRFPTHTNELILDRTDAQGCEVFMVVLEPGESPPIHVHDDMEQVYYVIQGTGVLHLGQGGEDQSKVNPGDVIHIPESTPHAILNTGEEPMRYVAVDVFTKRNPEEPTWDSHVRTVCANFGWNYEQIRSE